MDNIICALILCVIVAVTVIIISWKSRGRINCLKIDKNGLEIKFFKGGR